MYVCSIFFVYCMFILHINSRCSDLCSVPTALIGGCHDAPDQGGAELESGHCGAAAQPWRWCQSVRQCEYSIAYLYILLFIYLIHCTVLLPQSGWTALHNAAMSGNLPAVQALLQAGADPAVQDNVSSVVYLCCCYILLIFVSHCLSFLTPVCVLLASLWCTGRGDGACLGAQARLHRGCRGAATAQWR